MGSQDKKEDARAGSNAEQQKGEQHDNGHSGEGAASALAYMISQGDRHRHQTGEADDAAGHRQ
jgi:hypothetical protein